MSRLLLPIKNPIDFLLQVVALGPIQVAVVLQASDDDPWCDTQFECESADGSARKSAQSAEYSVLGLGNQPFLCERVGLGFLLILLTLITFQEYISSAVQEDMPGLVKEREPQVVIRLVAQAQLYQCPRGRQPPGRTPYSRARKFRHEHYAHARFIAFPSHRGGKVVRQLPRQ